jgi:amidase
VSWSGTTAQQIAKAVRRGDADAAVVVDHHLQRMEDLADSGDALTCVRKVEALAEAAAVDELDDRPNLPAAGVPVAVCEQLAVTGHAPRLGSNATVLPLAETDHEAVQRFRGAGAVVVGLGRSSGRGGWAPPPPRRPPPPPPLRAPAAAAPTSTPGSTHPRTTARSYGPATPSGVRR